MYYTGLRPARFADTAGLPAVLASLRSSGCEAPSRKRSGQGLEPVALLRAVPADTADGAREAAAERAPDGVRSGSAGRRSTAIGGEHARTPATSR